MKNRIFVTIMAAALSLPAMAGWINQKQQNVTIQQEAFQSTSTMQGSGSAYTSNPTLNIDGSASTPSESAPAVKPRKSFGDNTDGGTTSDPNSPVGDAALPLLLFAAATAATVAIRNRRRQMAE